MADVVAPLRHLKTYPADGPLSATDIADHQIAAGTVPENYALRARGSATRKVVFTNDAAGDINAPLRAALIADSATIIATDVAVHTFNKTLTLLAGAASVQGARIRVAASGWYTTKASAPGDLVFQFTLGATTGTFTGINLVAGMTLHHGWAAWGEWIVRAVGTSASIQPAGGLAGAYGGGVLTGQIAVFGPSNTIVPITLNLTVNQTVSTAVQFSVADPANTITMTAMSLDVALPGVVVS